MLDLLPTAGALGLLGLVGFLAALVLLGSEARTRRLDLAIATLVCATASGLMVALGLGAVGRLRLGPAALLQAVLAASLALLAARRFTASEALRLLAGIGTAGFRQAASVPFVAIALAHAAFSATLRGLLRPPLSWDSVMYHLLLAATWLRDGNLAPFFAPFPNNFNGATTANGAVWLWWWLAPSHSDLFANLAFLGHWALLGLAVGALARDLGARRRWPVAAMLTILTPIVLRLSATQYVDVFVASLLVAGCFFGLRWARRARWPDALLAALALGPALGAKLLVPTYVAALAFALVLVARGDWARRAAQGAVAVAVMVALGGYFYFRNASLGLGPFFPFHSPHFPSWPTCDTGPELFYTAPTSRTLWRTLGPSLHNGMVTDAFLGAAVPQAMELGIGPQAVLLAFAAVASPLLLSGDSRRSALVLTLQIAAQLAVWVVVPYANGLWILSNVRFLIGAVGLAFALGVAALEVRGARDAAIDVLAAALAVQSLLFLHAELPREVRIAVAWIDVVLLVLLVSARARELVRRRLVVVAAALAVGLLPLSRWWVDYRYHDRYRAYAAEYTLHSTPANLLATAWAWLEVYGGDGTVAVVGEPETYFIYPAMGERLARRVTYVNVNALDSRRTTDYPNCNPRVDFDAAAWLANAGRQSVRWLLVTRRGGSFPVEDRWASEAKDQFALRYEDQWSRVYERTAGSTTGTERAR